MTELEWYYEGSTSRIMGLADDYFRRAGAKFLRRRDIPAYEVNMLRSEGSDEPGVNESARISFSQGGAKQVRVYAVAEGTGCRVTIEDIKDGWDYVKPHWLEFVASRQQQNEVLIPTIINSGVDDQLLSELNKPNQHMHSRVKFFVDASRKDFQGWIKQTVDTDVWKGGIKYATERGEFQVTKAILSIGADSTPQQYLISIHGFEITESDEGQFTVRGEGVGIECIRFTLQRVKETRTQVLAECCIPMIFPYYQQLLRQIAEAYPETVDIIQNEDVIQVTDLNIHEEIQGQPWSQIPDYRWDRKAVELLLRGYSSPEIGRKVGVDSKTIDNRLSTLRKQYPEYVLTRDELRKRKLE